MITTVKINGETKLARVFEPPQMPIRKECEVKALVESRLDALVGMAAFREGISRSELVRHALWCYLSEAST